MTASTSRGAAYYPGVPLDYFNSRATPSADELAAQAESDDRPLSGFGIREQFGGRGEPVAVPAEFDATLDVPAPDRPIDAATTAAIEAALRYADVAVFRGRDASARGGPIELHVRRPDLDRAREVARDVIERRERFLA